MRVPADFDADAAARQLLGPWKTHGRITTLAEAVRPRTRAEGYRVQAALAGLAGDDTVGWKVAATSVGGQQHIGVSGPLAGRLFRGGMFADGGSVPMRSVAMSVAEAEFAFRIGRDLVAPHEGKALSQDAVMNAVADLHPAIEIPDSRFEDFAAAGEAQLIADFACACYFVLGEPVRAEWRTLDLAAHRVRFLVDSKEVAQGSGANVLGDPRIALTWLANELIGQGTWLQAGDIVMTGTCVIPVPIHSGQSLVADFGTLGAVTAQAT